MIAINLSEKHAVILKDMLSAKPMSCSSEEFTQMKGEVLAQIRNQQFDEGDELPWDTDTAWSRYEQICTALSGCQLASQYK